MRRDGDVARRHAGDTSLVVALHDSFLSSHCSSCFLQIPPSRIAAADSVDAGDHPPSCGGCAGLRYCSVECRNDDLDLHASSGECHFIRLVHFDRRDETTDLRAALRLLCSIRNLGFLPPRGEPRRIAGLLAGGHEQLEEGCELWLRIREGRMLMSRAREMLRNQILEGEDVNEGCDGGGETEAALWVVITNGVEVQIGEGRAIGIGVYGPRFSWFNHSCSPNACYRFELHGSECFRCDRGSLVYPSSTGPEDDAMPFHHLSLKAYTALASIYRVRGRGDGGGDAVPGGPEMARAAAAYALLLAGTTHHLFLSDPSLMATAAHFWVNAGESFLSLTHCPMTGWINLPEFFDTIFLPGESSLPWDEFRGTSFKFVDCVSRIASKVWADMVSGIRCLSEIKSPVDFRWLGEKNMPHESLGACGAPDSYSGEGRCVGCRCEVDDGVEDDSGTVRRLAVHCLVYGGYLATLCYGPRSHCVDRIRSLPTR
ncbi:unnamed protein product [Spirodela intermedia]|uniref:Uncharacterized protein n=1 Tax=Spirodela intermedia TaxID=51605 RepID=A0A7I8JDQ5_SPIIN|nr:unnamed protein product [Spirodela intermedia]CAA6667653.1 unnamed protein product [Spirodela intermedia]